MSDTETTGRLCKDMPVETNIDLMVERAIGSLVARGEMSPEDAAVKRADLRHAQEAAWDRAETQQIAARAQMDGDT